MNRRIVLLTVWCQQCKNEGRKQRGRLGTVERRAGGVVWATEGRTRVGVINLDGEPTGATRSVSWPIPRRVRLRAPGRTRHDYVPKHLPAVCKHHGQGRVSSADVIDQTGSISLTLIALG